MTNKDTGPIIMNGAVQPDWVDYNGHMNYAFYVVAFDRATDVLFEHLGLGAGYREECGHTIYVVETHVTYIQEMKEGEMFAVESVIADADDKRLHLYQRLLHSELGVCATSEVLCLNIDQKGHTPRAVEFGEVHRAAIQKLMAGQASCPREISRSILIRKPSLKGSAS
jgi:acyl-CoA thioester hydrolase